MARTVAHYEADSRRNLRGKDAEFLRGYIGRGVIQVLIADRMLEDLGEAPVMSPALRKALSYLKPLAAGTR